MLLLERNPTVKCPFSTPSINEPNAEPTGVSAAISMSAGPHTLCVVDAPISPTSNLVVIRAIDAVIAPVID